MELKRAKEVLEGMNVRITDTRMQFGPTNECFIQSVIERKVRLDGEFYSDQLIAIATWMRDPEGVVGA